MYTAFFLLSVLVATVSAQCSGQSIAVGTPFCFTSPNVQANGMGSTEYYWYNYASNIYPNGCGTDQPWTVSQNGLIVAYAGSLMSTSPAYLPPGNVYYDCGSQYGGITISGSTGGSTSMTATVTGTGNSTGYTVSFYYAQYAGYGGYYSPSGWTFTTTWNVNGAVSTDTFSFTGSQTDWNFHQTPRFVGRYSTATLTFTAVCTSVCDPAPTIFVAAVEVNQYFA